MQQLGTRIKRLRKSRGMPARVLGEKIGVCLRYVYDIESGRYKPSLPTLAAIAEALGVPPVALLTDVEPSLPPEYTALARELSSAGVKADCVRRLVQAARDLAQ